MEDNLLIPTKVVKSKRKSILLSVNANGELIVRAPICVKNKDIYKFINLKSDWIIKHRTKALNSKRTIKSEDNEKINLLGDEYCINFYDKNRVEIINNIIFLPKENYKNRFINFIIGQLRIYITNNLPLITEKLGFNYKEFSITKAKTRWGSCSFNNRLNFSVYLIFCPYVVVDYVIIHELCHTVEKNHSDKFWNLVEKNCPNYKESEKWLKENRAIINLL